MDSNGGDHQHMTARGILILVALAAAGRGPAQAGETLAIRGHDQSLHLYGRRGAPAIVLSSGDGGWLHLAPYLAQSLAGAGYYVIGFDAKAYLSSFTSGVTTLREADVVGDFRVLIERASSGSSARPILVGISEGAGLSVLAAADPLVGRSIGGVIAVGLPDLNELGWRWKDSVIYLTKGVPNEPTFSAAAIIGKVSPLPLAAIYSAHDEYVPFAEVERLMAMAHEPKQLWVIDAADHRFSNNLAECDRRLFAALAWVHGHTPS